MPDIVNDHISSRCREMISSSSAKAPSLDTFSLSPSTTLSFLFGPLRTLYSNVRIASSLLIYNSHIFSQTLDMIDESCGIIQHRKESVLISPDSENSVPAQVFPAHSHPLRTIPHPEDSLLFWPQVRNALDRTNDQP